MILKVCPRRSFVRAMTGYDENGDLKAMSSRRFNPILTWLVTPSLSLSLSHTQKTEFHNSWYDMIHECYMYGRVCMHAWNQPYYRTCMFCYNWCKLHFFWICCVVLLHGNHSLPLISTIKEEIELHGLQSTVSVSGDATFRPGCS